MAEIKPTDPDREPIVIMDDAEYARLCAAADTNVYADTVREHHAAARYADAATRAKALAAAERAQAIIRARLRPPG